MRTLYHPLLLTLILVLFCSPSKTNSAEPAQAASKQAETKKSSAKLVSTKPVSANHAKNMKAGMELFRTQVKAILESRCLKCHGGETIKADFDLSSRELLVDSGMIDLDDVAESHLLAVIRHEAEPHMPPKQDQLPKKEIDAIQKWLKLGAPFTAPFKKEAAKKTGEVTEADRRFWSFQPLTAVAPPMVKQADWVRTPVDQFILHAMEQRQLQPNMMANKKQLVRRAYFDLIGLPPTPQQVDEFIHDDDPAAWENLIDGLLESKHYGERWARHWMDIARFAESHGYEQDYDRKHAYHYRDFLIQAFNKDLPFNTFVQWQIAGDELAPEEPLAWMATGFLGAGAFPTQLTEAEFESARYDELDDMASTTSSAILGLTLGCARCHDHKFDPIPTKNYYQFVATFATAIRSEIPINIDPAAFKLKMADWQAQHQPLEAAFQKHERETLRPDFEKWLTQLGQASEAETNLAQLNDWLANKETGKEAKAVLTRLKTSVEKLKSQSQQLPALADKEKTQLYNVYKSADDQWQTLAEHNEKKPKLPTVQVTSEGHPPTKHHADGRGFPHFYPETYFLTRGDVHQKTGVAPQSFIEVLMRGGKEAAHWKPSNEPQPKGASYRRSTLAAWLTDTEFGAGHLTARVIVNRLWQHHLGTGLISTPSDFGFQGERPSHPHLLDWLAIDLVHNGWKLKRLHKLIMTSAVYMQGSQFSEANAQIDRQNKYLWRWAPRRLEAEAIRDAMLSVSGQLDKTMFGPGTLDLNMKRRSVYFFIKRSKLIPTMMLFDWPEHLVSIGRRSRTTIAPQALMFMNSTQGREYATAFAGRLKDLPVERAIISAYQRALSRAPTVDELAAGQQFVAHQRESYADQEDSEAMSLALTDFCQIVMSLNEFVYLD